MFFPRVTLGTLPAILLAATSALWAEPLLLTPSAVNSSTANDFFNAANLIDDSGLSGVADLANYAAISHASASPSRAWVTTAPGGGGSDFFATGSPDPVLTFTFSAPHQFTDLVLWGFYFTSPNNDEAKTISAEFSNDGGSNWGPAIILSHSRSGSLSETLSFGASYLADVIRLTITDNHFGTTGAVGGDRVGLGEVKFIGRLPANPNPEISLNPLLDFGSIALGAPIPTRTLSISNRSASAVLEVQPNSPGAPFQISGALTIPPGESRELTVSLSPLPGCHFETLELTTNDPERPLVPVYLLAAYDCDPEPPSQPSLLPAEGTFVDPFEMTIATAATDGLILYTTDGSLPSPTNGTPYTGPLTIESSTQIRAAVLRAGKVSKPQTKSYLRLSGGLETYTSDLPIAIIDNFGAGPIPDKGWSLSTQTGAGLQQVPRQPACLHLIDRDPASGTASITGIHDLTERIGIRVRGAFSSTWNPKPYSLETWDEFDADKNTKPLGLPGESNWILYYPHPNYDLPLIANTFSWELSSQTGRYGTRFRFVDVFLNEDGGDLTLEDRVGVYALAEKVTRDDDRLEFEALSEDGTTGGWLLSINRMDPIPVGGFPAENGTFVPQFFHTAGPNRLQESPGNFPGQGDDIPRQYNAFINFEDPNGYRINPAQRDTIETWFREFEDVFYDDDRWLDPVSGYRNYLNTRDFIDYYILHTLAKQGDSMLLSVFPWVSSGDRKLHLGPLWDYNLSAYSSDPTDELFYRSDRLWYPRLFDDPGFMREFIDRWYELRRGPLALSNMQRLINKQASEFTFGLAVAQGHTINSWSEELTSMKGYLSARTTWIDSQFFRPPTFSHPGGVVSAQFTLTITNNTGRPGTIFFTVDGSDPMDGGGSVYTGPLAFNATAHLKARVQATTGEWSALNESSYVTGTPARAGDLVLSEIMYFPAGDPAAEFLELLNISEQDLDLALLRFSAGVEFTFPVGATLAAGERVLVVRSHNSFQTIHGTAHNIAGEFLLNGALDNSGDHLTLLDASGSIILDFSYGDDPPWPNSADGGGDSLVLQDPLSNPDHSLSSSWRSSTTADGNPGSDDRTTFAGAPGEDRDGDGIPALLEHLLGTSDRSGDLLSDFFTWNHDAPTGTALFLAYSLAARDIDEVLLEFSDDLITWQPVPASPEFHQHLRAARARFRWHLPAPQPTTRYFRAKVSVR